MSRLPARRAVRGRRATVAVLAVLALAGCGSATGAASPGAPASPVPTLSSTPTPAATLPPAPGPQPLPGTSRTTVSSVAVGSIGVATRHLERLATDRHGVLQAPKDPDRAGWYSAGTLPGQTGPAVIAGHVDSTTGPAVFFRLREVQRGDKVVVGLSDGTSTTFVVDRVVTTPKAGFPTEQVFGPTPDAELRLITCGGPYDRTVGAYVDNTVVFASVR